MKRFLIALLAGGAVFSIAFAAAAALSVNGGVLQAGADGELRCTRGVQVEGWGLETDTNSVQSVRISGFGNCAGADAFVRLTDSSGGYLTGNLVPSDGNPIDADEERFDFAPIDPADVHDVHVWIEGGGGNPDDVLPGP